MRIRGAALLVLGVLLVAACSGGSGESAPTFTAYRGDPSATTAPPTTGPLQELEVPELDWYQCRLEFECATFFTPIDYRNHDRGELFITLERIAAADPDRRIGVLLVNPGGPGGSGNDFVTFASLAFPQEVLDRFDIVGWDPRGVGESSTVDCIRDPQMEELMFVDWADPVTRGDGVELARTIAEGCENEHRASLPWYGTVNAARDMDVIRQALGEEQISFAGFSYGTKLGAVYATLYPEHVRAMVLDGALVSGADPIEFAEVRAAAFEQAYASFAAACRRDPSCPIEGDPVQALRDLLARAGADPLPTDDPLGRTAARPTIIAAVGSGLYDVGGWPLVAEALSTALAGTGDVVLELADQSWGRDRYEAFGEGMDAFLAVTCADQVVRPTMTELEADLDRLAVAAPLLGADQLGTLLLCSDWPAGASPVPDLDATAGPPLVVIGTTNDPATPFAWARGLADDLGNAVVLEVEGDGHTAFPWNACVRDLVLPYLLDLTVPSDGARCSADQVIPPFGFGADQLYEALLLAGIPPDGADCLTDGLSGELEPADLILLLIDDEISADEIKLINEVARRCVEQQRL